MTIESSSEQDIEITIKVMGGENWIDELLAADVLTQDCKTVAYSYVGPTTTYPIYHEGTLGRAKAHLHETANILNEKCPGGTWVCVCKALVTKASVFIPAFSPYILALFKVMKGKGIHEACIEQMQRLFEDRLYAKSGIILVDSERLIRVDDWELRDDVQQEVEILRQQTGNLTAISF